MKDLHPNDPVAVIVPRYVFDAINELSDRWKMLPSEVIWKLVNREKLLARPHPDSFNTLAEFFAAFAEWERFYEPWEKMKSERSKRGYIAWNPETKKPAYGKQADKVLGPKKERKKTVKAANGDVATKEKKTKTPP
jgi:hypothetical protein